MWTVTKPGGLGRNDLVKQAVSEVPRGVGEGREKHHSTERTGHRELLQVSMCETKEHLFLPCSPSSFHPHLTAEQLYCTLTSESLIFRKPCKVHLCPLSTIYTHQKVSSHGIVLFLCFSNCVLLNHNAKDI